MRATRLSARRSAVHLAPGTTVTNPARTQSWWWGFAAYAVIALAHVAFLAVDSPLTYPSKLALMPVLALAAMWALRGTGWGAVATLLIAALAFSWLGDGAAAFFPFFEDELPMMLLCFGLAHACYVWLFWRYVGERRLPWWSAVYAVWWVVLVVVLWPLLGGLAIAVAIYGLLLGATAVAATRCNPAVLVGAVFFLASDTMLAFDRFTPNPPDWLGVAVMVTYTIGQGLIALGVVRYLRAKAGR
ncbi:lysoplasmalogenase [Microbacterium sp. zg-YB36]|uniref:lysoplasmalogenase n=1 Tax=Microbacterium sp. zg-YB36 TaxID=2969407 RepID=UPI00214B95AB|nr:lysoplasmalogenase [Microbacterium sp. zg-YB36]MDL5353117.1 lysoplasmalogenase [Microbacterium sp. zg-YB36]